MAARIHWDESAWLLRAIAPSGETVFTWTYPMFEKWIGVTITPSTYHTLSGFIQSELTPIDLKDLCKGEFNPDVLISHAVDYFRELDYNTKLEMKKEIIEQIEYELEEAEQKELEAMNWLVDEDDEKYPLISRDMCDLVRDLVKKYKEKVRLCDRMLQEETGMQVL